MAKIIANGTEISIQYIDQSDYISLTDIAKKKNLEFPADVIKNWLRVRSTIDFLGLWEQLNNPDFKLVEFDQFRQDSGANSFVLSPQKWIKTTNAKGIISKSGRYGGTYAHSDIAFEFASWISPEFKLYIIKDYQRLKQDETNRLQLGWDSKRELSKINYTIHTDAVKEYLISPNLTNIEKGLKYASEADLLNIALFGKTARQWRTENPNKSGNIRDYASVEQLIVLINLESLNADFIRNGIPQEERLVKLRNIAYYQLNSLKPKDVANRLHIDNQNLIEKKLPQSHRL